MLLAVQPDQRSSSRLTVLWVMQQEAGHQAGSQAPARQITCEERS
jgi:hypothetical protein